MKNICVSIGFLLLALIVHANPADTLNYGTFGKVTIYLPSTVPDAVVLFVSGDGGWNQGVVDMAKNIVAQGAVGSRNRYSALL